VADEELLRVVVVRRGKVRAAEFRLREGEIGLSLFRKVDAPDAGTIVAAVHAAGKQGDLAVAELPVRVLRGLGLSVVPTPGGTPDPDVNRLHVEARPSFWRRLVLRVGGKAVHEWFNETVTPRLAEVAKLVE
jgi:hypothetical protein